MDMVEVEFEPGSKLGFSIERNCVSKVAADGPAAAKGVKGGWVIRKVAGEDAPTKKEALMKMAAAAMKKGAMSFTFQTPLGDGIETHYCKDCDKFIKTDDFGDGALDEGPGKQICYSCAEFASW